jgi:predicted nucleic acid-binding protein
MLYLSKNPTQEIELLIKKIQAKEISAAVVAPVLIEVFKHLCVKNGKDFAINAFNSFRARVPLEIIQLTDSLIIAAGNLKCRYRGTLSYIDCIIIAFAIEQKIVLHTTEKELKNIPKLTVKEYGF